MHSSHAPRLRPPRLFRHASLGRHGDAVIDGAIARADVELGRLVGVDVLEKQGALGLRGHLGALDGRLHLGAASGLNLLELRGSRELEVEQVALCALDGVASLAHAGDLVAVAVGDARV